MIHGYLLSPFLFAKWRFSYRQVSQMKLENYKMIFVLAVHEVSIENRS